MRLQLAICQDPALRAVLPSLSLQHEDGLRIRAATARDHSIQHSRPRTVVYAQYGYVGERKRLRGENTARSPSSVPWLQGAITVSISTRGGHASL